MATETLANTKAEDAVEGKGEVREVKEQSEVEEMEEKEGEDLREKYVSMENEENEGKEEEGDVREGESRGEKAESKKGKRGRKQGSVRGQREVKKSGQESAAKRVKSSSPKELVTPNERPTRERKTVERYSEPLPGRASASKGLSIEKACAILCLFSFIFNVFSDFDSSIADIIYLLAFQGSGTQLKDIPNGAFCS